MGSLHYAVYLRKSRADDPSASAEETLLRHREALEALADKLHIVVAEADVYREVVSGESLAARPEMQRLLARVREGDYAAVLCMDIDRLGRGGMADQGIILDTFQAADTLIVTPDKQYDLTDDTDAELTEFKAFFARREYKMIRKRMTRGLRATLEAGGYTANAPYGYRSCRIGKLPSLEIVPEEARFIRHIYSRYLQGTGASTIADELNAMGSTPRRSDTWTRNTVRHILRNPTFAGKVAWDRVKRKPLPGGGTRAVYTPKEKWLLVDGQHQAIIAWDDWQRAQEIRETRSTPSHNTGEVRSPLVGLVRCGVCGQNMQMMGVTKGVPYLLCTRRGCQAGAKLEYVEDALLADLADKLADLQAEINTHTPPDTGPQRALVAGITAELARVEARLPKIYELLEDGTYTRDIYLARLQAANDALADLRARKADAEAKLSRVTAVNRRDLAQRLADALEVYRTLDPPGRNAVLRGVVRSITYFKPKKTAPRAIGLDVVLR